MLSEGCCCNPVEMAAGAEGDYFMLACPWKVLKLNASSVTGTHRWNACQPTQFLRLRAFGDTQVLKVCLHAMSCCCCILLLTPAGPKKKSRKRKINNAPMRVFALRALADAKGNSKAPRMALITYGDNV